MKKTGKNILFLLTCILLTTSSVKAQNWDIDLLKQINPSAPTSPFWKTTSSSAYWVPAAGMIATYVAGSIRHSDRLKKSTYKALLSVGISTAVAEVLKYTINRTRPAYAYPGQITEGGARLGVTSYSFPSGHTTLAFNYATTLALEFRKWYITVPAYAWAASVGYSRLYLGKHYPSDVMVGAVLGTATGWLSYKLSKRIFKH